LADPKAKLWRCTADLLHVHYLKDVSYLQALSAACCHRNSPRVLIGSQRHKNVRARWVIMKRTFEKTIDVIDTLKYKKNSKHSIVPNYYLQLLLTTTMGLMIPEHTVVISHERIDCSHIQQEPEKRI
jgi:hypothetical protein